MWTWTQRPGCEGGRQVRTRRGRGVFSSHGCGQRGGRAALAGDAGGFLVSGAAEKRPWVLVLRRVHPRAGKGGHTELEKSPCGAKGSR